MAGNFVEVERNYEPRQQRTLAISGPATKAKAWSYGREVVVQTTTMRGETIYVHLQIRFRKKPRPGRKP